MAKRLNAKGMEKLSAISDKYRFKNTFELEQDDVYEFCTDFQRAIGLGLNVDPEDEEFIDTVLEVLCG